MTLKNTWFAAFLLISSLWLFSLPTAFGEAAQTQATQTATVRVQIPFVSGAIVCPDLRTVFVVVDLYRTHFTESLQDAVTGGQSQMVRGTAEEPNLKAFGCSLLRPGTRVRIIGSYAGAVKVEGQDTSDHMVSGITAFYMLEK